MPRRLMEFSSLQAAVGKLSKCLAAIVVGVGAAQADQLAFTLTYDDLGVNNLATIPNPYPGISAATVTHQAVTNAVFFEGDFFWGGVSPGNGYGNLTNVVVGPTDAGAFAGFTITPSSPSNHVHLISFDIATKDDGLGDLSFTVYVQDADNVILSSPSVSVTGDADPNTHTFVNFSGIPVNGPIGKSLSVYWPASNGRVGVDNVQFEIVGPTPPMGRADFYTVAQGGTTNVAAPGVLGNDALGGGADPLTAGSTNAASLGTVLLTNNGGFAFTSTSTGGMGGFTYRANDGGAVSSPTAALISVLPPGVLFDDDFARPGGLDELTPWQVARSNGVALGSWTVANGLLQGTSATYRAGYAIFTNNWTDYSVEARASLPSTNAYGWGVSGRLNPVTGANYGVFMLPYGPPMSGHPYTWLLTLIKYTGYDVWSGSSLSNSPAVNVGGPNTNLHALKLTFQGNRIQVQFDGTNVFDQVDGGFEGPPYASGGIAVGMYTTTNNFVLSVEDVIVRQLGPTANNQVVVTSEDVAINVALPGSVGEGLKTFTILAGPTNGALTGLNAENGAVSYTPATNYHGPDAFTFTVSDGTLVATGLVSVTVVSVIDIPVATDLILETLEDTVTHVILPGSAVEGPARFAIFESPTNGVLSNLDINTGAVNYIPTTNYIGFDAFTFTVSDGTLLATGLVSITVVPDFIGFHGGVEVAGNLALLPDAARDLGAYSLGTGTNTSRFWTHTDAGRARRVAVRGRYAFVAGGSEGLIAIDLSDPDLAVAAGQFLTDGDCVDVAVSGNIAFAADLKTGVRVLDVTDPRYPLSISIAARGQFVSGLEVIGNLLFVAAGPAGLQIYDVSDPTDPFFVAGLATGGSTSRVRVQAGFAYLVCGGTRLEVINVQNPQTPVLAGSYATVGSVADLDVSENQVFLANTIGTLEVLSVSNAANPFLLTNYNVAGGAVGVRVVGNLACLRDLAGRLVVVELAGLSPLPPQLLRPIKDVIGLLGQEVVLSVEVGGSPPLTYHWFKDGTPLGTDNRITGVTGPLLKLSGLVAADAGAYSVIVTNAFGQVFSSSAMLTLVLPGTPLSQGAFEPGGFTAGVWMDGRYAYAAAGELGLHVFDVSNPHFPVFKGSFDTDGLATAVEVLGSLAFVADGAAGLQIINLSDIPFLTRVGSFDTPGSASGLSVVGSTVYVADGEAGLRIIDASNPTQPRGLGGYDTPGTASSVRHIESLAYIADGAGGLQIINVTNPANPFLVGSFDTAGTAYRVEVVGSRAFVADGVNGLLILDVSDPTTPTILGHYPTSGPVMGLVVVDTLALLAEGTAGLEVVNISDPNNVVSIAVHRDLGDAQDVKLVGNRVCVAGGGSGVRILSLFGIVPPAPEIASAPGDQYLLPGQGTLLQVAATGLNPLKYQWFKNGRAFSENADVRGVVSDTLHLTNLTLADSGEYTLVVRNAWNLEVSASVNLNVVPLGTPIPHSDFDNGNDLLDVWVFGQLAYVASRLGGLEIIDFRDLQAPVRVGSHPTLGFAQHVEVRGHLAYVAAWDSGLEIFDVAEATNIVRIGRYDTPGLALGVYVTDQLAYVADQTNGLQIIDVRNPSQPFWVATVPTRGPALNVQVRSGKAYVATSGAGLEIFDVSDPLGVVRLGWIDTPGEAVNVEVIGTRAYVSDYDQGLQIINVSNPSAPALLGEFPARGDLYHVQVVGNLAYVAQGLARLEVLDISNPLLPTLALAGKAGTTVHALQVSGKHAYFADRTRGFVVAEFLGLPPVPPQLIESPGSRDGIASSNLVLSVAVSGTPPFAYQWFRNGIALGNDTRIHGVSEPHLRVNNLTNLDAGAYFVVVSSPFGVATSSVANVTVATAGAPPVAPAFVSQPVSRLSLSGASVTFQAVASGSVPLSFRWHLNGEPLFDGVHYSGVTSESLVVSNIALPQEGVYQLKASNVAGLAMSQPATLTFIGPLQDQINNSPSGGMVALPAGVYEERLVIAKDLTLVGAGPGATTLDALGRGTSVIISNGVRATLSGLTIRNGRSPANEPGGAIKNLGQLRLQNCELTNNVADIGGGIANLQIARVLTSIIRNNSAADAGGGVFNAAGAELEITDSRIADNAARLGGGIFNAGWVFATNSTVSANRAVGSFDAGLGCGGGIYSTGTTSWIVNCTISGNQATVPPLASSGGFGGGVFAAEGVLELRSSTLAFNLASTHAGGVSAGSNSLLRARNTIFAGNLAANDASDFGGTLVSAGFNLLQATASAVIVGGVSNDVLGLDPLLAPLQDNGGVTLTHALRSGSPAIDAGACSDQVTDQRGMVRPMDDPAITNLEGGCDIGAFEFAPPPVILSLTGAGTTNVVLTWSAISNQIYRLLYSDDVREANWFYQPPDVTARGETASATNVTDSVPRRFYRVLLLP